MLLLLSESVFIILFLLANFWKMVELPEGDGVPGGSAILLKFTGRPCSRKKRTKRQGAADVERGQKNEKTQEKKRSCEARRLQGAIQGLNKRIEIVNIPQGVTEAGHDQQYTLTAIARRNLDPSLCRNTEEALLHAVRHLSTVRLDREGITTLANLDVVREVRSLYLQKNLIKKIENLDALKNLRFLSLSGNRIEEVINLCCLQNLKFLDLSHNLIQRISAGELPLGLLILDLTGNVCTQKNGYRQELLGALPLLQELDGEVVRDGSSPEPQMSHEGDEDSDGDDISLCGNPGALTSLSHELLRRSHQRRDRALKEHQLRLEELNDTQDLKNPVSPGRDSSVPLTELNPCTSESLDKCKKGPQKLHPRSSTVCNSKAQCHTKVKKNLESPVSSEKNSVGTTVAAIQGSNAKSSVRAKTTSNSFYKSERGSSSEQNRSGVGPNLSLPRKTPLSAHYPKPHQTGPKSSKTQGMAAASSQLDRNERQTASAPSRKPRPVNAPIPSQLTQKTAALSTKPGLNLPGGKKK
ncbi:leucine-rich repeat-containing protein 46 [Spea bombifrons]|uniref:leucine-rich repeat-containing protein 46 n=1 Tax=Spea bombifrons TaxID=233779 RepID=UPI0023497056|nr:leucine-rich repeat-containing protein 46 [Spea bombifrons]